MANPEHVKIVKMGPRAINRWIERQVALGIPVHLDLRGAKLKRQNLSKACLSGALMQGVNLSFSCLKGADISFANMDQAKLERINLRNANCVGASLQSAQLIGADLRNAKLSKADFSYARLLRAKLNSSKAIRTCFYAAILCEANLMWTNLSESDFSQADCTGAHFWNANIHKTVFSECILKDAEMSGIWLHETNTEGWNIDGVICDFFLLGPDKRRIPKEGTLASGEFSDRFKSRPTIEFMFEAGMPALGPAILGLAIDKANSKNPKAGMRLLDISSRGGMPRAIIEVAAKVEKDDALKLIASYYKQVMEKMSNELEVLRQDKKILSQIVSHKMLLPAMGIKAKGYRKRGRPTKYTFELIQRMIGEHEHYSQESNGSKYAWSKVAEIHGIKSGKAAEMACKRWMKKRNK